jgi:hypothetical protein
VEASFLAKRGLGTPRNMEKPRFFRCLQVFGQPISDAPVAGQKLFINIYQYHVEAFYVRYYEVINGQNCQGLV